MDTVGTGRASQLRLPERQFGWRPPHPRRRRRPSISGTRFIFHVAWTSTIISDPGGVFVFSSLVVFFRFRLCNARRRAKMEQLLAKLKVPPDAAAAELYQSVQPLRQMVAFQAAFVAGCCQQAMELGTSKLQEKFAFTWQQRLAAYRALPDGTEVPPPDGDAAAPPELLVGLVGCGALGSTVVQTLLDAGFAPSQLLVSTRSPQQHQALLAQGVRVAFHNAGVAARVHLLVLAVLPAQLADVAKDIRGALSPRAPRLPAAAPPTTTHTHPPCCTPQRTHRHAHLLRALAQSRSNPHPSPEAPTQARW